MLRMLLPAKLDCEVLVAGAGPAGAATAAYLAAAGVHTMLVDAQVFPRDKVCGDFVGPAALRELQALGITQQAEYRRSNVVREASLYLDGRHLITHPVPQVDDLPPHGRVVPRKLLDAWILAAARQRGAEVVEGSRVQGYVLEGDTVKVELKAGEHTRHVRARVLVAADGSGSVIARQLRGVVTPDEDRIIALRAYFDGVGGRADRAELYFSGDSFPGYYWLFPTADGGANVGVGMVLDTLPRTEQPLKALLQDLISRDPALRSRLGAASLSGRIVGWPLTTYNPALAIVGDRVLLVGDAAGLINPLNGEGIQYAMQSGRWAAQTLLDALPRSDLGQAALLPYAHRVARELRYDMALSRVIVQLIRNRSLNALWLQALQVIVARARGDADYAAITGGVLAGLVPASRVLRPDIVRKTVMQAALHMGFGTARHMLRGPAHLRALVQEAGRQAMESAGTMARHRQETVRWGLGVAGSAVELGVQAASQAVKVVRLPVAATQNARSIMYSTTDSTKRLSSESGSSP
jgi:menaquinone-9 beta-reductase